MGEAKQRGVTNAQSWRAHLAMGERYEIRALLLGWPVKAKDAKARNRAIEAVDDDGFEQPYGLSGEAAAEWLTALNARLREPSRAALAVTSENAAVILDVLDAVLDDEPEPQSGAKVKPSRGGDARIAWRLRHATAALEAVRRGEFVAGVAEPIEAAPSNGSSNAEALG